MNDYEENHETKDSLRMENKEAEDLRACPFWEIKEDALSCKDFINGKCMNDCIERLQNARAIDVDAIVKEVCELTKHDISIGLKEVLNKHIEAPENVLITDGYSAPPIPDPEEDLPAPPPEFEQLPDDGGII